MAGRKNGYSEFDAQNLGKAFITMVGMASDAVPYDVKGDTISVHAGGIAGDLVLTKNSDGTLQGMECIEEVGGPGEVNAPTT